MAQKTPDILKKIVARKQEEIAESTKRLPIEKMIELANNADTPRGFFNSLNKKVKERQSGIIAEIKKASPSKGVLRENFEPVEIAKKVIQGIYDGVTTTELDNLAAETAANMATAHPDYGILAARIAVSNLHKNTRESFSQTISDLYHYVDKKTGRAALIAENIYDIVQANAELLDETIEQKRDFEFDFFGHGHTVLGHGGGAERALEHHIATLRAQSYFDRVGQNVHAFNHACAGFAAENYVFCCHLNFSDLINYSTTANRSSSFMTNSSSPMTLTVWPLYLPNNTRSPTFTFMANTSPLSLRLPGPTAKTSP